MTERTSKDEKELLDLEHRFWDAMADKDAERAAELTDDGCIIVGAQGVSAIDGPTMAKLTEEGAWELELGPRAILQPGIRGVAMCQPRSAAQASHVTIRSASASG